LLDKPKEEDSGKTVKGTKIFTVGKKKNDWIRI